MSVATGFGTGIAPPRWKSRRSRTVEEVQFPVTPMLDMAFQLLAFFVLTFQSPSEETHLDLELPATPVALPGTSKGKAQPPPSRRVDADLENDLWVRLEANDLGELTSIRLGESAVGDLETLGDRLKRYTAVLQGRPLRIRIVADDGLRYEHAARAMAVCDAAGVASIRLSNPVMRPAPAAPGGGP